MKDTLKDSCTMRVKFKKDDIIRLFFALSDASKHGRTRIIQIIEDNQELIKNNIIVKNMVLIRLFNIYPETVFILKALLENEKDSLTTQEIIDKIEEDIKKTIDENGIETKFKRRFNNGRNRQDIIDILYALEHLGIVSINRNTLSSVYTYALHPRLKENDNFHIHLSLRYLKLARGSLINWEEYSYEDIPLQEFFSKKSTLLKNITIIDDNNDAFDINRVIKTLMLCELDSRDVWKIVDNVISILQKKKEKQISKKEIEDAVISSIRMLNIPDHKKEEYIQKYKYHLAESSINNKIKREIRKYTNKYIISKSMFVKLAKIVQNEIMSIPSTPNDIETGIIKTKISECSLLLFGVDITQEKSQNFQQLKENARKSLEILQKIHTEIEEHKRRGKKRYRLGGDKVYCILQATHDIIRLWLYYNDIITYKVNFQKLSSQDEISKEQIERLQSLRNILMLVLEPERSPKMGVTKRNTFKGIVDALSEQGIDPTEVADMVGRVLKIKIKTNTDTGIEYPIPTIERLIKLLNRLYNYVDSLS